MTVHSIRPRVIECTVNVTAAALSVLRGNSVIPRKRLTHKKKTATCAALIRVPYSFVMKFDVDQTRPHR